MDLVESTLSSSSTENPNLKWRLRRVKDVNENYISNSLFPPDPNSERRRTLNSTVDILDRQTRSTRIISVWVESLRL